MMWDGSWGELGSWEVCYYSVPPFKEKNSRWVGKSVLTDNKKEIQKDENKQTSWCPKEQIWDRKVSLGLTVKKLDVYRDLFKIKHVLLYMGSLK